MLTRVDRPTGYEASRDKHRQRGRKREREGRAEGGGERERFAWGLLAGVEPHQAHPRPIIGAGNVPRPEHGFDCLIRAIFALSLLPAGSIVGV